MANYDEITAWGDASYSALAEAALDDYDVVKLGTASNEVDKCGANEIATGCVRHGVAINLSASIYCTPGQVYRLRASAAITKGVYVKGAADGEIAAMATTGTTVQHHVGIALKAATAANEIIPVLWLPGPHLPAAA